MNILKVRLFKGSILGLLCALLMAISSTIEIKILCFMFNWSCFWFIGYVSEKIEKIPD